MHCTERWLSPVASSPSHSSLAFALPSSSSKHVLVSLEKCATDGMKQCCEGDAVNDATIGARNCNNNGGAPSQVHQQILASSAGGRAIQGGYGMERLRPGLRVKFVSNWTLKMKPVNHRRFSLRRSCYGFGRMAEKGPLLLATMGNVPQCIETSSAVADLIVEKAHMVMASSIAAASFLDAPKPQTRSTSKRLAQNVDNEANQAGAQMPVESSSIAAKSGSDAPKCKTRRVSKRLLAHKADNKASQAEANMPFKSSIVAESLSVTKCQTQTASRKLTHKTDAMASQDEEHMALQPSIAAESISDSPECQTKSVSKIVAPKMDSKASQEEVHLQFGSLTAAEKSSNSPKHQIQSISRSQAHKIDTVESLTLPDFTDDIEGCEHVTRSPRSLTAEGLELSQGTVSTSSTPDNTKGPERDVKLNIQRVLETLAQRATDPEQSSQARHNIASFSKTAQGFKGGKLEAERGGSYQEWGGSLSREPLSQKLAWQRGLGLGIPRGQQAVVKQSGIVQEVVEALSGLRSGTGVAKVMTEYVGRVKMSELNQVLSELGQQKEWLTALQVFDWMHGVAGYKPDVTIYQTMIILLGKAQRMDVAESLFEGMVKEGLEPGQNEYTSLIAGYIRSGSLQRGIAMLERMKEVGMRPSVSIYNTLIDGCTRAAVGCEIAQALMDQMRQEHVAPDKLTYTTMITIYSRKGWHKEAIETFEQMQLCGCVPERSTYNTILSSYSRFGDVKGLLDAHRLMMEQHVEQDSVTFNIIFNTLSRLGRIREVGRYYALMRKLRVLPDLTTCSILINGFGRAREWEEVDAVLLEMENLGLQPDTAVYNALVSVYGKAGLFREVELIVKTLRAEGTRLGHGGPAFDLVTYNTLLDVYGRAGRLNDVINTFSDMKKTKVQPDVKTFNALVNAYGRACHFDGVKEVLELFRRNGNKPDLVFYNTLLFMFGRGGQYEDAWQVLDDMKHAGYSPTVETYNSLILVFGRGSVQQALRMFAEMLDANVQPNSTTLKLLMDTHAKKGMVDDCLKIYREAPKFLGRECDETLLSTAFGACCNMRCIEEAEKLLVEAETQGMPISLACYNWLILGYGRKGEWKEAERVLGRMKVKQVTPNTQSFTFLLEAYSICGQIYRGEALIAKIELENLIMGTGGYNALIRFHTRVGDLESAFQVYEVLQIRGLKPNQNTYATLIEACAQEGSLNPKVWGLIHDVEAAQFGIKYLVHTSLLVALARCGMGADSVPLLESLQRLGCSIDICNLFQDSKLGSNRQDEEDVWARLKALFQRVERDGLNMELERAYHNALIDALWSFGYETKALKVAQISVALGVFGQNVSQWGDEEWALDVRTMSTGAAQVLLLTWLDSIRKAAIFGDELPCRIKILQAWEWQLKIDENKGTREAVAAHLNDLRAPFLSVNEGQEMEAAGPDLLKWLSKKATAQGLILSNPAPNQL